MYIFSLSFYIDRRSETKVGCGDTNSKIVCVCCIFFLWQIVDVLTFLWPRSLENSITSFGDRSNDFETASDYFKSHFIQVHRRKDVSNRSLYVVSLPFFFFKNQSNNLIFYPTPHPPFTKSISLQCWYANSICFQKTRNPNWLGYITYLQKLLKTTGRESNTKHYIKWWVKKINKKKNIMTVKKKTKNKTKKLTDYVCVCISSRRNDYKKAYRSSRPCLISLQ